jgi:glyoxylase-like metal-dependent hydrolase (beta-lactamase superfamily II)
VCFAIAGVGVVLTGDHVLPRISPNVGAGPFTTAPPLGSYLDSLEVVSRFDDYEALPGHEYRFRGLTERSRAIAAHHDERTAELEDAVRRLGRATTWTVASSVSWARGWEGLPQIARRSALAESAAHLMALRESGRVAMSSDVDGDWWECLAGAQD